MITVLTKEELLSFETRFWAKVDIRGPNECWPWKGATKPKGYGSFRVGRKTQTASRVAYALANGKIELCGCHYCDNPPCCNPAHIFEGTNADNTADRDRKGRGVNRNNVRLTEEQVIAAYFDPRPAIYVADELGVDRGHIKNIRAKKSWKHLTTDFPIIERPSGKSLANLGATAP